MMLQLTLQQLFGVNAVQNENELIIHKSDLPYLFPSTNNRAEQLLAALLLQAHQNFEGILNDELNRAIIDFNNTPITYNNKNLYEFLDVWQWKPRQIENKIQQTLVIHQFQKS